MKKFNKNIILVNDEKFKQFFKLFVNTFIFNGKKSFAIKYIDELFFKLKNKKFNPFEILYNVLNRLIPLIGCGKKKFGSRKVFFPFFLKSDKKKFVILMHWLVKDLKKKIYYLWSTKCKFIK